MERLVTPPRRGTSPTWGPPPPIEQALPRLLFKFGWLDLLWGPTFNQAWISCTALHDLRARRFPHRPVIKPQPIVDCRAIFFPCSQVERHVARENSSARNPGGDSGNWLHPAVGSELVKLKVQAIAVRRGLRGGDDSHINRTRDFRPENFEKKPLNRYPDPVL